MCLKKQPGPQPLSAVVHLYPSLRLELVAVNITVVMGIKSFSDINLERKQVQKIITHKDYKPPHLDSDLCLLLLATPIEFNKVKMPICLPQRESSWDRCWMAEWAYVHGHGMHFTFMPVWASCVGCLLLSEMVVQMGKNWALKGGGFFYYLFPSIEYQQCLPQLSHVDEMDEIM